MSILYQPLKYPEKKYIHFIFIFLHKFIMSSMHVFWHVYLTFCLFDLVNTASHATSGHTIPVILVSISLLLSTNFDSISNSSLIQNFILIKYQSRSIKSSILDVVFPSHTSSLSIRLSYSPHNSSTRNPLILCYYQSRSVRSSVRLEVCPSIRLVAHAIRLPITL